MERAVSDLDTSKISGFAARVAIAAAAAACVLLLCLHVLSPEYSPAWRMISEYANGSYAWVLTLMFAAYGLSSFALAFAIRSEVSTRRTKIGLGLLAVSGVGQVLAGPFDLNLVAPHELAGVLGIFGLPIAAVLITPTLASSPGWSLARRPLLLTAKLSWVTTVLWLASFIPMIATFYIALGGALPSTPPETLPDGVIAFVGWTNRLVVLSAWAWVVTVASVGLRVNGTELNAVGGCRYNNNQIHGCTDHGVNFVTNRSNHWSARSPWPRLLQLRGEAK